jgi:hypothetical protein
MLNNSQINQHKYNSSQNNQYDTLLVWQHSSNVYGKNIPNTSIFGINKLHTLKQPLSLLLIQHNHSQFTDVVINYIQLFDK